MILVFDLDGTICEEKPKGTPYAAYADVQPKRKMIEKIREYHDAGHKIIIHTARHMVSTNGDLKMIEERVGKITRDWLEKNNVPYDELIFGKPYGDMYIDDKAMQLDQFLLEEML